MTVKVLDVQAELASLSLGEGELILLGHALNEVLHGPEIAESKPA